jgi:hypothetical protein
MKRLRIFRDWTPSAPCDFDYKDFKIVADDSYDYAILFNTPMTKLKPIPKERVLGLAWEPHAFKNFSGYVNYAKANCGAYVIGDPKSYGEPFIEGHSFMYDYRNEDHDCTKTRPMCIVASQKNQLQGHKFRHELIRAILKTDLDIDIYGRGIASLFKDDRIRGGFKHHSEIYPKYMFDLTIENCREGSYITEKIFHPLVHKCCPIYWGSPKVADHCNDFYYSMPTDIDKAIGFITAIISDLNTFYNLKESQIFASANKVKNYNYLDFANEYFETGQLPKVKI